ncbi:MAG: hypothetical protein ACLUYS_06990, partial [Allobaculum sp.]|uniref:hypothetical protein n=1 Tax=Allobaculum sp. TaxID=1872463 RepID=UPI00399A3295
ESYTQEATTKPTIALDRYVGRLMFVFERPIFCKLRNIKPPKDKGKFSIFRGLSLQFRRKIQRRYLLFTFWRLFLSTRILSTRIRCPFITVRERLFLNYVWAPSLFARR